MALMAHPDIDTPIIGFLARHGLTPDDITALPSDASLRRYFRVNGAAQLLMDDRTDPTSFAAFIRIAQHLSHLGLSAPRVFDADPTTGLALIEDFGTATYGNLLKSGHDETALYALAIDTLVAFHSHPATTDVTVPTYDMALLREETSRFSHWFVPAFAPDLDVATFDTTFSALWADALAPLKGHTSALVLRDFHIDNLMLLDTRTGTARCGLLDFQDAVLGAGEYDLMSLLQDARRDLAPGLEQTMLDRYLAAIPAHCGTATDIMHRYHLLAAQRHTRLAGQFIRLYQRDQKPGYLQFMPRVMQQMQSALTAANLHEIAGFIDETLPGWRDAGTAMSRLAS